MNLPATSCGLCMHGCHGALPVSLLAEEQGCIFLVVMRSCGTSIVCLSWMPVTVSLRRVCWCFSSTFIDDEAH